MEGNTRRIPKKQPGPKKTVKGLLIDRTSPCKLCAKDGVPWSYPEGAQKRADMIEGALWSPEKTLCASRGLGGSGSKKERTLLNQNSKLAAKKSAHTWRRV